VTIAVVVVAAVAANNCYCLPETLSCMVLRRIDWLRCIDCTYFPVLSWMYRLEC
jgi:hypothetical protein